LTTVPTVPPLAAGAPGPWFKNTITPGNFTISKLPFFIAVPPMATKIFLLASMSFEFRCTWPIVTPSGLGGSV